VIAGEGPERKSLELLAKNLGLERNVNFTGRREDMPAVYAAFDICVLPSFVEAMPMTILEAMAAGNPVIATRVGEIPTTVENETTGILVAPNDARELRNALLRLLRDGHLRQKMGQNGRARVQKHFSLERMSQSYFELYRQICGAPMTAEQAADFAGSADKEFRLIKSNGSIRSV
jgi:glycosyltransferase involved in cell wall biosynthesis